MDILGFLVLVGIGLMAVAARFPLFGALLLVLFMLFLWSA